MMWDLIIGGALVIGCLAWLAIGALLTASDRLDSTTEWALDTEDRA